MGAVFLGTPAAAIPSLSALADVEDVDLVVTQPDRRTGRGSTRTAPPVRVAAEQFGFPVAQPETPQELAAILEPSRFSLGLVVAYGRILTPVMLSSASLGFLNVHYSLLPRWRGAAPVERAIEAGDERTGVTLMKIDEGLDTGPILGEIATPIGPNETGGSLTARLSYLGASLIDSTVPEYLNGRRRPVPQITSGVSQAKRLTKEEARLTVDLAPATARRRIRAFHPRPVTWLETPEGVLRIHEATQSDMKCLPGHVETTAGAVIAGFTGGAIELTTVQPSGKQPIDAQSWMHGRRGLPTTFE